MSSASKAKGTLFESQLADFFQANGIDAKRLPRTGAKDIGDLSFPLRVGMDPVHMVVEAKNRAAMNLPVFLEEAAVESDNYEQKYPAVSAAHGMVISKRRGKGVGRAYVVFDLTEWINLMKDVGLL